MSGQPSEAHPSKGPHEFALSHAQVAEGAVLVKVQGDLDLASAPALKWGLADLLRAGSGLLVLDLSGVAFMDSTAIGVLVGIERTLGPGQRLALVHLREEVLKVFEITGLEHSFAIFDNVDDALARSDTSAPGHQASTG